MQFCRAWRSHTPSNLYMDDAACVGEFRTTFRTIPRPRSSVDRATVS